MNTLGCLKNRKLFFTVLDTRKSKVKVPADLVPSESSLPVLQTANFFFFFFLVHFHVERDYLFHTSFIKGIDLIHVGSTIMT